MNITIVMATYNGGKYIREQLDSIIPYMGLNDELIVSDDGSVDDTCTIVEEYLIKDKRIKLVEGPHKGVVKNFENALQRATKEIIMFSDQDDVWLPDKLPTIRRVFEENNQIDLLHHDKYICTNEMIANNVLGVPSFSLRSWGHGVLRNLLYSCYYGCCMAMRAEFMMKILPFSEKTIAYDQLIGLVAEKYHTSYFLKTPLIKRREHGDNMSRKRGIVEKMRFRYKVWQSYSETIKKNNF